MADAPEPSGTRVDSDDAERRGPAAGDDDGASARSLRERVEEKYDFEHFTPADMAEMTVEEWEAVFDADAWVTGAALLDRVEAELRSRVARRNVFAVVERVDYRGTDHVLAYTDVAYALVAPDGTVEGEGSILEDVEVVVALCSIPDFEVHEPPADAGLPDPDAVADGIGGLGDTLLLAIAVAMALAGLALLLVPLVVVVSGSSLFTTVAGLGFLGVGVVLALLVANARLSGRFRAEEYRERLRAAGVGSDERPAFLPPDATPRPRVEAGGESAESAPD